MNKDKTDCAHMPERYADTERNKIINRASSDLENIINGHDPEIHHLGNRVWDRLDKMAVEIECRRTPHPAPVTAQEGVQESKIVERKFYHSEWKLTDLLAARHGGLVTDEGEAWSYRYSHKDGTGGKYDLLFRREPVAHPPQPSEAVAEALEIANRVFQFNLNGMIVWGDDYNQAVKDAADAVATALRALKGADQ